MFPVNAYHFLYKKDTSNECVMYVHVSAWAPVCQEVECGLY